MDVLTTSSGCPAAAFADGGASPTERAQVEGHLERCAAAARRWRRRRRLRRCCAREPPHLAVLAPPGLARAIAADVEATSGRRHSRLARPSLGLLGGRAGGAGADRCALPVVTGAIDGRAGRATRPGSSEMLHRSMATVDGESISVRRSRGRRFGRGLRLGICCAPGVAPRRGPGLVTVRRCLYGDGLRGAPALPRQWRARLAVHHAGAGASAPVNCRVLGHDAIVWTRAGAPTFWSPARAGTPPAGDMASNAMRYGSTIDAMNQPSPVSKVAASAAAVPGATAHRAARDQRAVRVAARRRGRAGRRRGGRDRARCHAGRVARGTRGRGRRYAGCLHGRRQARESRFRVQGSGRQGRQAEFLQGQSHPAEFLGNVVRAVQSGDPGLRRAPGEVQGQARGRRLRRRRYRGESARRSSTNTRSTIRCCSASVARTCRTPMGRSGASPHRS